MTLQYIGHSCCLIETEYGNLLIDPFITNNPLATVKVAELPTIHWVALTHGHDDHFGDTLAIVEKFGCSVICSPEIANLLTPKGINCISAGIGGFIKAAFGSYKMVSAVHSSSITIDNQTHYAGLACGFILKINEQMIYHAGDTALTLDMTLLSPLNIQVALLPVGGTYTMDIKDANDAITFIKPKVVIPIHYNTFDTIKVDLEDLKNPYGKIQVLQINEKINL